jgi:hypothetical protein
LWRSDTADFSALWIGELKNFFARLIFGEARFRPITMPKRMAVSANAATLLLVSAAVAAGVITYVLANGLR